MPPGDYDFITSFATAYDGAALGLALGIVAASSWAKYLASSSALRRIHHAPFSRISDLRSLLTDDEPSPADDICGRLVVVRGQVQINPESKSRALVSLESGELAAIVKHTEKCLYNESWGIFRRSYHLQILRALFPRKKTEECSGSLRSVPFVLAEVNQQSHSAYVHVSLDNSTHKLPLTLVYSHMRPVQTPWYSFIWIILGHRYPVAMLSEESILPIGKEITAVGVCRNRDGALEIKSCIHFPYFLSDMTKDEIEADLTINTKILFWSGVVLGTFSISILSYALMRNWHRLKGLWNRNLAQGSNEEQPANDHDEDLEDVPEGELCVICLTRRRIHAFLPCGHRVCCQPCAISVKTGSRSPLCPVCRQEIHSSIRVYNS